MIMLTQAQVPAALEQLRERTRVAVGELRRENGREGQNIIRLPEGAARFGLYSEDRAALEASHGHAAD